MRLVSFPMEKKILTRQISQDLENIGASARSQAYGDPSENDKALSLRARRLSSPQCPPDLLRCELRPFENWFNTLDISYSTSCTWDAIQALCSSLSHLLTFVAQSCGLSDTNVRVRWPRKLQSLDFARNQLTTYPLGIDTLHYLHSLNLSGNSIVSFDSTLLSLPCLEKLHLTGNPIISPPKHIVQEGIAALRVYCGVSATDFVPEVSSLPPLGSPSSPPPLGSPSSSQSLDDISSPVGVKLSLSQLETTPALYDHGYDTQSFDSEHGSDLHPGSSEMDTQLCGLCACEDLGMDVCLCFNPDTMLSGYSCQSTEDVCQIYTPNGCDCKEVSLRVVKDTAFFPLLKQNESLATPVVSVEPHNMGFPLNSPAVLVLPHCIDVRMADSLQFIPLHSASSMKQAPKWEVLKTSVDVYTDCIKLTTTHFSLFSVIVQPLYPSISVDVPPETGAIISVPQLPGLCVHVPPGALPGISPIALKTTVYYADCPLLCDEDSEDSSLASACIGLEPHGLRFSKSVSLSFPIPDYEVISQVHNGALSLWTAEYRDGQSSLEWREADCPFVVNEEEGGEHVACFSVSHFSFWKWMWSLPQSVLSALRAGAVYTFGLVRRQCVSVRCQVLMSPPIHDRTFGLAVAIYRFGEPLRNIANYKWILADSGESRRFLKTGTVEVAVTGSFEPISEFEDNELRERFNFTGQDFCLEFALKLKDSVTIPLQDHQVIGKLVLKEVTGEVVTPVVRLNLIKPPESSPSILPSHMFRMTGVADTPPPTPEQSTGSPSHRQQWEGHSDTGHSSTSELPSEWGGPSHRIQRKRQSQPTGSVPSSNKRKQKMRRIHRTGVIEDDRFLLNISRDINNRWQELGIELGLSHSALQSIPVDQTSGVHMCAYIMLQEWKRQSPEATYHHLQLSLEKIHLHECVHKHLFVDPDLLQREEDSSDGL